MPLQPLLKGQYVVMEKKIQIHTTDGVIIKENP